jgi:hypothetical protein
MVARLTLVGLTTAAGAFLDRAETLRDDARAVATSISPDLFIEKIRVRVSAPVIAETGGMDDLATLIDQSASDPGLMQLIKEDLEPFLLAAQTSLGPPEDADLRRSAAEADWPEILKVAGLALRSRMSGEA